MTKEKNRGLYGIVWKRFDVVLYPGHLLITKKYFLVRDYKTCGYLLVQNFGDVDASYHGDVDSRHWVPLYDKAEVMRCIIGGYDYIKEKYGKSTEERNMSEVPK